MLMVLCFRPGEISLKKGCYRLFFVCLFIYLFFKLIICLFFALPFCNYDTSV